MQPTPRIPILLAAVALCVFPASPLFAQTYSGSYSSMDAGRSPTTLQLRELGGGDVTGSFARNGTPYRVDGVIEDGVLVGVMRSPAGDLYFEAERSDYELWLTLFGADARGEPDYEDFVEIGFSLDGSGGTPGRAPVGAAGSRPQSGGNPLASGNPLSGASSDPYVGYFTDGAVTLELWGGGGQYEGQVWIGGGQFPVRADGNASGLRGSLQTADGSYVLTAQLQGGVLVLVSEGVQYYLHRDTLGGPRGAGFGGYGQRGRGFDGYGPGSGRGSSYGPGGRGGLGTPPMGVDGGLVPNRIPLGFSEDDIRAREWLVFLSGKTVQRLIGNAGRGPTDPGERIDVSLCSDRSFYSRDATRPATAPNRSSTPPPQGWWTALSDGEVVILLLEYRSGAMLEFRLHFADRRPYANGSRIFVAPAEVCR